MTDLLGWFNPARWIMLAALVAAVAIGVPLVVHRYNDGLREEGREEVRAADKAAAEAQTASNRELSRMAELHLSAIRTKQEQFFTKTITEVRHVTESLASCPVPADAVRLLNAARDCAGSDSPGACGTGDQVPAAR